MGQDLVSVWARGTSKKLYLLLVTLASSQENRNTSQNSSPLLEIPLSSSYFPLPYFSWLIFTFLAIAYTAVKSSPVMSGAGGAV